MVQSIGRRLRQLERCLAAADAKGLLVIVTTCLNAVDPTVDADIDALKAAGFLRRGIRVLTPRDNGEIEGLTETEQQFLAERRMRQN
jgi:hypothetical protein